jgi:flagellar biosynthesis regulator FlaF
MKYGFVIFVVCACLFVQIAFASDGDCLCISSETVRKYSDREFLNLAKNEVKLQQEKTAERNIQRLINQGLEADEAKDANASKHNLSEDFTIKDLDGKLWTLAEMQGKKGAASTNYEGIIKVSDESWIKIEALTLQGSEAIVYTNQHFVRYMPDRKDGSPHEVITNIIHREIWVYGEQGWKFKHIEELERGTTYLDGAVFNIS